MMKKNIQKCLFLLTISLIFSCSGDSDEGPVTPPIENIPDPVLADYHLVKKVNKLIDANGDNYATIETIIDNDVLVTIYHKDQTGAVETEEKFEYNDEGILSRHLTFKAGELLLSKDISYDDQNRMIEMEQLYPNVPINDQKTTYTYDVDGEVHASHVLANGFSYVQKFKLENGYIVGEIDDAGLLLTKVEFTDQNITYVLDPVGEVFYTYEANGINPMGFYPELFGENKYNMALFNEVLENAVPYYSVGLVTEEDYRDGGFKISSEYTLNEVNLPMSCKSYNEENGEKTLIRDITFEYQVD